MSKTLDEQAEEIRQRYPNTGGNMEFMVIPIPRVAPLGIPVNTINGVQEVWDTFIKPAQDAGEPQSIEERVLMAILRSMYVGVEQLEAK